MTMTLQDVCRTLGKYGFAATADGSPDRQFVGVATLEEADETRISFLSNPKYEKMLGETDAGAVVLKPEIAAPEGLATVRTADPYAAITALIVEMHGYRKHKRIIAEPGTTQIAKTAIIGKSACIYPGATIDDEAKVGANATIYPGAYVGPRCRIGDNVILFPNVVIYDDCVLGNRVTIHAGTSIGNDGLGYAPINGTWVKIPQIGIVEIEDDVEIGANCAIDRATLGRTKIGRGTKTSNLIAIGHGTEIGEHCMFVAQVGLAGSVKVGNHVTLAGQVGVVGHVSIGENARIGAKAGVTNNVPDDATYLGQPAIPISDMRRQLVYVQRLPELTKQVKKLEAELEKLRAEMQANA